MGEGRQEAVPRLVPGGTRRETLHMNKWSPCPTPHPQPHAEPDTCCTPSLSPWPMETTHERDMTPPRPFSGLAPLKQNGGRMETPGGGGSEAPRWRGAWSLEPALRWGSSALCRPKSPPGSRAVQGLRVIQLPRVKQLRACFSSSVSVEHLHVGTFLALFVESSPNPRGHPRPIASSVKWAGDIPVFPRPPIRGRCEHSGGSG